MASLFLFSAALVTVMVSGRYLVYTVHGESLRGCMQIHSCEAQRT